MKTRIFIIFSIIAISFSFFSCMTTPSGDAVSFGYTPEEKYTIGKTVGGHILGTYSLYYDKNLYTYLNLVCNSIIINSDGVNPFKGYFIGVLDSDEINAFATSGGHILITRGMLKTVNSEDELAAVIAHEISHIQLEHSIKAIKINTTTQDGGEIATSITKSIIQSTVKEKYGFWDNVAMEIVGEKLTEGFQGISTISTTLINTGYSNVTEFDADKNAITLMHNTGYNPYAMIKMLENLKSNSESNYFLGFGKTHPAPELRISNIEGKINRSYQTYDYNEDSRTERFEVAKQYF